MAEMFVMTMDEVIRLILSIVIGGLIGAEREYRDKAAGFRTIILICFGATLFTMFSLKLGAASDQTRIAANIVSGVGFLGAGAILRDQGRIMGLTTASTIWLAAALGMGVGGGSFVVVAAATGLILIVLWLFPSLEGLIDRARMTRRYRITLLCDRALVPAINQIFRECDLKVSSHEFSLSVSGEAMIGSWQAYGTMKAHDRLMDRLFTEECVREVHF